MEHKGTRGKEDKDVLDDDDAASLLPSSAQPRHIIRGQLTYSYAPSSPPPIPRHRSRPLATSRSKAPAQGHERNQVSCSAPLLPFASFAKSLLTHGPSTLLSGLLMVTMCEMVTTEAPAKANTLDDLVLVSAAASAPKPAAMECVESGSNSSGSGSSSQPRLGHSISTDSFLQHDEADVPSLLHNSSTSSVSSTSTNTAERVDELKPLMQHTTQHMSAPFACVAAMAPSLGLGNSSSSNNKNPVQHMVEWEQASRQATTWGTNAVLQQHQQHAILSSSASTGHLGGATISCNPPSGAGFKRPRTPGANSTSSTSSSANSSRSSSSSSGTRPSTQHDISPQDFLWRILQERGYETSPLLAKTQAFFRPPTSKQVEDYDMPLVNAVKTGDLEGLRGMAQQGRQMDACNRYGESIVHISCRRGQAETLRFLLSHGGRVHMCDDLGRTPLHDACWAKVPVFDCISTILDADPELIRVVDCRGASPLAYIRREHWSEWREFFDSKKEKYWAPLPGSLYETAAMVGGAPKIEDGEEDEEEEEALTMDASGVEEPLVLHSASAAGPVTASMVGSSGEEEGGEEEDEEEEQMEEGPRPTRASARQRQRKRSRNDEKRGVDVAVSASCL